VDCAQGDHFYVFCLVSFVLYAFDRRTNRDVRPVHPVGQPDRIHAAAGAVPAFAVSFSDAAGAGEERRTDLAAACWPRCCMCGAFLVGCSCGDADVVCDRILSTGYTRWHCYMALYYVVAAVVFHSRYVRAGRR